jgi:hypothetical protein
MIISRMKEMRASYLDEICHKILAPKKGTVNIADVGSKSSRIIADKFTEIIGGAKCGSPPSGQSAGRVFAEVTRDFLKETFALLHELRPGHWVFQVETPISNFDQYKHLSELEHLSRINRDIAVTLGTDYLVKPDIVVYRKPVPESNLDSKNELDEFAQYTPLRAKNSTIPILHASISCKWTMRSDRSQNTRTEALNFIRNRKGNTPHITAVTAEPLPTRIASLALGTGDLDCVYHMGLPELIKAVELSGNEDQLEMLMVLIDGRRLRDISDLVFDLAI